MKVLRVLVSWLGLLLGLGFSGAVRLVDVGLVGRGFVTHSRTRREMNFIGSV